ncbi:hypothetical protein K4S27_06020 [Staphylococcus epidermidis]|nr:hypothetical protein [Staphylococcus epidermidis]MCG2354703.1 hypothetical protein [Staphylococcus epidermidis]MCG2359310.1 hypothetical protein [Staphylococcus epidermidis]MCG2366209.1 hypothetical protein [Staphylococcus epidermidis]MCG2370784.1 hypothetical protein [Staphylococcus epidermidis]
MGVGLLMFERGFFWAKEQEDVLDDSQFYIALHNIMPIWIWGILGMIFSLMLIVAPFFLPKHQINNTFNYLIMLGGAGNALFYFLMTSASIFHAINWLTPLQFSTLAVLNILIFVLGVIGIVRKQR